MIHSPYLSYIYGISFVFFRIFQMMWNSILQSIARKIKNGPNRDLGHSLFMSEGRIKFFCGCGEKIRLCRTHSVRKIRTFGPQTKKSISFAPLLTLTSICIFLHKFHQNIWVCWSLHKFSWTNKNNNWFVTFQPSKTLTT